MGVGPTSRSMSMSLEVFTFYSSAFFLISKILLEAIELGLIEIGLGSKRTTLNAPSGAIVSVN